MAAAHYVRFARALAFVSAASGCAESPIIETHDVGPMSDAYIDCTTCACLDTVDDTTLPDGGVPACVGIRVILCRCSAVGPLAPPELRRARA